MKLDELDIDETSPLELLKRKLSPALHMNQYSKASELMYDIIKRKEAETNGNLRHGLGYYAMEIGRQFRDVDTRALIKFFIDKYPEMRTAFDEDTLAELKIEIPDDEGMGIPRKRMPQIKNKDYPEFIEYLADNGATFKKETVPADSLRPVQNEFSKKGVEKQMKKYMDGKGRKPIIASQDNYIMDGHHRWLVGLNTGGTVDIFRVNKPGRELLDLLLAFPKVYFKDIYNEDDVTEKENIVRQSDIWKVVNTLADRRDDNPFPVRFYDGGYMKVKPSTAKSIVNMYYRATDSLRDKMMKVIHTYNGFKEIAKAAGAVQESAGVGKITKQNTTPDVKPGETERQAKKFFGGNGKPKPLGVKGATPNQAFNLGLTEGYKLQLERDDDMYVLHITDSDTGKRTEVRGKSGYESGNYDADDKLHQLLDKVGKSANIAELINGEVVSINPKHPDGEKAKAATDVAYNENISVTGTERGREAKRKKLVPGSEAWFKHWFSRPLLTREEFQQAKDELVEYVNENFKDGKVKGKSRPGRVKAAGASCNGSVTELRRKAKNSSGEKQKMYHWCANMKAGKQKG